MLNDDEKKEIMFLRQHYRACFSSPSGRVVLKHMLFEMRFFNDEITSDDEDSRVLRNYASTIIERLGCADDTGVTMDAILDAVLNLPMLTNGE